MSYPCLFLDRDGVINHDPGDYTKSVNEFSILPDVIPTLKAFYKAGWKLIIITNQGGIAKGLYTHKDVSAIHTYLAEELAKSDVELTDIFYSPHHDDFGKSLTRKPNSLMVERAIYLHNIDAEASIMVGDKMRDVVCGEGAGVKGVQIPTNGSINFLIDFEQTIFL